MKTYNEINSETETKNDKSDNFNFRVCLETYFKTVGKHYDETKLINIRYKYADGILIIVGNINTGKKLHSYHDAVINMFDVIYYSSNVIDRIHFHTLDGLITRFKYRNEHILTKVLNLKND
jgi:hypothetical protein